MTSEQQTDDGIGLLAPEKPRTTPPPAAPAAPTPPAPAEAAPAVPHGGASSARAGVLRLRAVDDTLRPFTAGTVTSLSAVLTNTGAAPAEANLLIEIAYTSTYPGEGAEWPVRWTPPGKRQSVELVSRRTKSTVTLAPGAGLPLNFEITAPVGVRYGDRVEVAVSASADGPAASLTLGCIARQSLLAIKTSRGYEREVADTLLARAEGKSDVIFALLVPSSLRGYVFAEGMSFEGVHEMLKGIRKARGLVQGETTLKEVEPLLVSKITVEGFVEGAIVELIAGPFKGEKARVKKIDAAKEEITVELIEALVPIPVTVRGDHVRMLERGGGRSGG